MSLRRKRSFLFWLALLAVFLFGLDRFVAQRTGEQVDGLIINEFLVVNTQGLTDADGDFSDWIEIYNRGSQAVNLSGWSLTDDPQQPQKWTFPNISLGSGQYLVVFASGKDRQGSETGAELHTNFKLNRDGEYLGLYNVLEGRLMDALTPHYPEQFPDISYGRIGPDLTFNYLAHPTPGEPNDDTLAWGGTVSPVNFSVTRGFYDRPFTVELTTDMPQAVIRYTTDGSTPSDSYGTVYTGPVPVNRTTLLQAAAFRPNFRPSPIAAQTYIFLDEVIHQPADPPGFPGTWGKHTLDFAGYNKDSPVQADYEMDPRIVDDPRYGPLLKEGLQSIPTLSIVASLPSFQIYANPRMKGANWERPVSVEFFDPNNGNQGFQSKAGIRIQGGAGRWEFMPKHSFRLFFRDTYGVPKLKYVLFPDSPVDTFDSLILRAGSDRGFAGHPDGGDQHQATYIHDEWLRTSQIAMSGVGVHGLFVHLYVNGLYWGLYNLVERPDDSFLSSYFGGDKKDWYVVNHSGSLSGSSDRFKELLELAEAHDLAEPEQYKQAQSYLDMSGFCDYLILEWYAGNTDWPQNNWYAGVQNPEGQVRYLAWDGEMTWVEGAKVHLGQTNAVGLTNTIKPLFEALAQNSDFKMMLADRSYKHLFNDGALTDANAQARWLHLSEEIELAIVAESARWGDVRYENPITLDDWRQARDGVLAQMQGNGARLIAQMRELDYYPKVDPPTFNRQGGQVERGFTVLMTPPPVTGEGENFTIYYTTDGSDPRQPATGEVAPAATVYTGPLTLTGTTHIKARLLGANFSTGSGQSWSALNETVFKVVEQKSRVAVTEIMYNPLGGNDYEFVELMNLGDSELSLAGMYFDEGITYTFPPGAAPLAPGERMVLARNAEVFAERYPGVPLAGVFLGKLANQGEKITLRDSAGETLISIDYDDENGWPLSPDGHGDSLVMVEPEADPVNPHNWRASVNLYGSPGKDEPKL